jgi:pilus assembly protein Flp/PilA
MTFKAGGEGEVDAVRANYWKLFGRCYGAKVRGLILVTPCKIGQGGSEMLHANNEKGQGLLEYALILVLVAIVVILILLLLGPSTGNMFSNVVNNV